MNGIRHTPAQSIQPPKAEAPIAREMYSPAYAIGSEPADIAFAPRPPSETKFATFEHTATTNPAPNMNVMCHLPTAITAGLRNGLSRSGLRFITTK